MTNCGDPLLVVDFQLLTNGQVMINGELMFNKWPLTVDKWSINGQLMVKQPPLVAACWWHERLWFLNRWVSFESIDLRHPSQRKINPEGDLYESTPPCRW